MNNAQHALAHHPLSIAVVGAGPVGLALALQAAQALPQARISVFDARPAEQDVTRDGRTLALSLGSVQVLEQLGVWDAAIEPHAAAIRAVHVSQQQPALVAELLPAWLRERAMASGEPEVLIEAAEVGVAQLGAVLRYGTLVAPLQAAWLAAVEREPQRLAARFGVKVEALKNVAGGVEVDAGIAELFDLAVVAEGGVFADQARKAVTHDYRQTAWVGQLTLARPLGGLAVERFTPQGPAALLPLAPSTDGLHRAALVWCVTRDDDPVRALDDVQRLALLNTIFPPRVPAITSLTRLKDFALGLNAERTLVDGRQVRIGNAAQTLHPVAGQGLNLGLRDVHALLMALRDASDVDAALRRVEWQRAPDRWSLIAATDFLARSFTWSAPGLSTARGLGLAALQALGPAKRLVARRMMFGAR
ncbi:FAD-dependent monooxygenase [Rivibacter subsaxonicus]|uniref:2-octaprenyl-6-methoxyphenol hydroxylase n=1 Tax=Rivibacter subsaxonicus TaxID=457575 RepID=A0A4Q7VWD5_9BURK|nr:FAD-dependent monooxygenase [Rivibacter subsaxonicus]RZU00629.1 2-octaprenyl-6-methoxyphenol hydroxylase [Rivibacter subsaxonicus]